jgi:hypothetical protein
MRAFQSGRTIEAARAFSLFNLAHPRRTRNFHGSGAHALNARPLLRLEQAVIEKLSIPIAQGNQEFLYNPRDRPA